MDEFGEDDPVVAEIPLFLSQTLSKQLYLFQYPSRPMNSDSEATTVSKCSFKPLHQEVRLEVQLDTEHERYDVSKGEQIALNTDGSQSSYIVNKDKEKNAYFKSGVMDKIQYESSTPIMDASKYAIAILQDGEMHFTPLNGIVQLRPSCSYFDKQERRAKEEKERGEAEEEAGTSADGDGEAKPVTVSFARTETDRSKRARETSFGFLARKSSQEAWCDAVWWNATSDRAELERNKLFAATGVGISDGLRLSAEEYLSLLVPPDDESATAAPDAPTANLNDLKRLPMLDQCKVLLKDAKVVTLGWACEVLGAEEAGVLRALSAGGRLLSGGRWAALSSLLYPPGSVSGHSGVPDQSMCRARDYVLYLFTQSRFVDRKKVAEAVKLPPDEVKEILSSVARPRPGKGWELVIRPDPRFEIDHPDVHQRQMHIWELRRREFNEMLAGEPATPKRQRRKSQRDSGSDTGMPAPKARGERIRRDSSSAGSDGDSRQVNRQE